MSSEILPEHDSVHKFIHRGVCLCVFIFAHVFSPTGALCCFCLESELCAGAMSTKGAEGGVKTDKEYCPAFDWHTSERCW